MDNALSCDILARVFGTLLMEHYNLQFHSDNVCIRCLAHIVNIVVQTMLRELDKAEDPDILDWFDLTKNQPVDYDPNKDKAVVEMEEEEFEGGDDEEVQEDMIDEILKDELPNNIVSLSVVKKVRQLQLE